MRRGRRAISVLVAAPLIAGCAAGRNAQTSRSESVSDTSDADVGQLQVRNVSVAPPASTRYDAGDDAPLYLTVANSSGSPDLLTAVRSDDARSVRVAPAGSSSASPTASATDSPSSTVGVAFPLGVPGSSALMLGPGTTHLVLQGLTRPVRPGQSVQVTFTFATAGSTTLTVPIGLPEDASSAQ